MNASKPLILILVLCLLMGNILNLIAQPSNTAWDWVLTTEMPDARTQHTLTTIGNKVYLYGGWDDNQPNEVLAYQKLYSIDFNQIPIEDLIDFNQSITFDWHDERQIDGLSVPATRGASGVMVDVKSDANINVLSNPSHISAEFDHDVLFLGGVDLSNDAFRTEAYLLSNNRGSINSIFTDGFESGGAFSSVDVTPNFQDTPAQRSLSQPFPRFLHTTQSRGNSLFLFGGATNVNTPSPVDAAMWELDLPTMTWTQQASTPEDARYHLSSAMVDKKMYCFGGKTAGGNLSDQLLIYDTQADFWRTLSPNGEDPWPAAREQAEMIAYDRFLLLFGGKIGSIYLKNVWLFDTETEMWTQLADMPIFSAGHKMTTLPPVSNGNSTVLSVLMFGGKQVIGSSPPFPSARTYLVRFAFPNGPGACLEDDLFVSQTSIHTENFQVQKVLRTHHPSVIPNGENVSFVAGESVVLSKGFEVELGATLFVGIQDCDVIAPNWTVTATENNLYHQDNLPQQSHFADDKATNRLLPTVYFYPNPVQHTATIAINLAEATKMQLTLLDLYGRKVATIVDEATLAKGEHHFQWQRDSHINTGVYILVLNGQQVGKLVVR